MSKKLETKKSGPCSCLLYPAQTWFLSTFPSIRCQRNRKVGPHVFFYRPTFTSVSLSSSYWHRAFYYIFQVVSLFPFRPTIVVNVSSAGMSFGNRAWKIDRIHTAANSTDKFSLDAAANTDFSYYNVVTSCPAHCFYLSLSLGAGKDFIQFH